MADGESLCATKSQALKKVAQLLTKGKLGKGDQKKLAKFVADAAADRHRPENKVAQEQTMDAFARKATELRTVLEHFDPIYHTQRRVLTAVIAAIQGTSRQLANALHKSARRLRKSRKRINFQEDFSAFVQRSNLIRYDLLCNPFQPIDVAHPVFADIAPKIQIAVPPISPVGLAKVVRDHITSASNQLSVTEGRYVLLMEAITRKWVFVSNPLTRVMGYVPSICLKAVAPALAVVVRTPGAEEQVNVQCGDYVAVLNIEDGGEKAPCSIVTIKGESKIMPRDLLGVIYE
jgi:hypothetical protein